MTIQTTITESIKKSKFIGITINSDGLSGKINGTYNGIQPHFKLEWGWMGRELSVIFYNKEGKWVDSTYLNISSFYKEEKFTKWAFEDALLDRAGYIFRF